ncbi:hypothetical protein [Actinomadura sp. B10D3]|uniref:hypothetical protein n=1 Tax=Actinomadura sp. B10D3 TaxID=3153557 RepID=UPI00325DB315
MTGFLYFGGIIAVCWLMIVVCIGLVQWQSGRAAVADEESDADRQARIRKMLDLPDEGEGGRDGYWRGD